MLQLRKQSENKTKKKETNVKTKRPHVDVPTAKVDRMMSSERVAARIKRGERTGQSDDGTKELQPEPLGIGFLGKKGDGETLNYIFDRMYAFG